MKATAEEQAYRQRLGTTVIELRRLRGTMSAATLAEAVDRSKAAISRWETGKATPSAYDLVRLAAALRAPAELLINPPEPQRVVSPVAELLRVADDAAGYAIDEGPIGQSRVEESVDRKTPQRVPVQPGRHGR